jgi:hypothetical protein
MQKIRRSFLDSDVQEIPKMKIEFLAFRKICVRARGMYNFHIDIFESSEESQQRMRDVAALFFYDVNVMSRERILNLIRQIAQDKDIQQQILCVEYFHDRVFESDEISRNERADIKVLTNTLVRFRTKLMSYPDKYLAQFDRDFLRQRKPSGVARNEIANFFVNLNKWTDQVGAVFGVDPLDYSKQAGDGDYQTLLHFLERADKAGLIEP